MISKKPVIALTCSSDFLTAGGVDIEPALYGEGTLNDTVKCDPARTGYEFEILRALADKENQFSASAAACKR